jgi:hypothetical protein
MILHKVKEAMIKLEDEGLVRATAREIIDIEILNQKKLNYQKK